MLDQMKNLKQLAGMLGNAGQMKERFEQLNAELEKMSIEADAGAGAVRVTVNGKMRVQRVQLDPAMVAALAGEGADADREMVEELIASAVNAAQDKAQEAVREQVGQLTGGMNLPGMEGLLGG